MFISPILLLMMLWQLRVHRHSDVITIRMSGVSANIVLHGGAEPVGMDPDACFLLNDGVDVTSNGGAAEMMPPVARDVTVKVDGIANDVELENQATDTCEGDTIDQVRTQPTDSYHLATVNSSLNSFDVEYAIILRMPPSILHTHHYFSRTLPLILTLNFAAPYFSYPLILFSCKHFSCYLSAPFSPLILSGSSFSAFTLELHAIFPPQVFRYSNPSLFLFSSLRPSHDSTIIPHVHNEFSSLPVTIFLPTFKSSQTLFSPCSCTTTHDHDGDGTNLFAAYSFFPSHLLYTSSWVCMAGQADDVICFCAFGTVECLGRLFMFHFKESFSYVEVRSRPDDAVWRAFLGVEIASLDEIGAFKVGVLLEGECAQAIGLKRVFARKTDGKENARVVSWRFYQHLRSESGTMQPVSSPCRLPPGAAPSPFHSLFVSMFFVQVLADYHGSRPASDCSSPSVGHPGICSD
jgi:hypothetical protein